MTKCITRLITYNSDKQYFSTISAGIYYDKDGLNKDSRE